MGFNETSIHLNETSLNESESCILPYPITDEQWMFYETIAWYLEGCGSIIIGSMGIIFNLTTINVLLGSDLASSFFNWLLVCLAIFDNLFLLTGIFEAFRNQLGTTTLHKQIFVIFLYPLRSVVMCCSIYLTIMLALERYNALAKPQVSHRKGSLCRAQHTLKNYFKTHRMRVIKYVGPIIVLASLFYIPKLFELYLVHNEFCITKNITNSTGSEENNISTFSTFYTTETILTAESKSINSLSTDSNDSYDVEHTCWFESQVQVADLRNNDIYILWYVNATNLLLTAVFPLAALAILNFKIFRKLKEYVSRQPSAKRSDVENSSPVPRKMIRKEKDVIQQTMVLFAIVILFLLFHILRILLNIEELSSLLKINEAKKEKCEWLPFWTLVAVPISHTLLQINSSINLFIYCFCNKSFRNVLKMKLRSLVLLCEIQRKTLISYSRRQTIQETNSFDLNVNNNGLWENDDESIV